METVTVIGDETSLVSTDLLTLIQSFSWLKVVTSHKLTCAARENTSLLEGRRGGEKTFR
jgi:hypothetical protein